MVPTWGLPPRRMWGLTALLGAPLGPTLQISPPLPPGILEPSSGWQRPRFQRPGLTISGQSSELGVREGVGSVHRNPAFSHWGFRSPRCRAGGGLWPRSLWKGGCGGGEGGAEDKDLDLVTWEAGPMGVLLAEESPGQWRFGQEGRLTAPWDRQSRPAKPQEARVGQRSCPEHQWVCGTEGEAVGCQEGREGYMRAPVASLVGTAQ